MTSNEQAGDAERYAAALKAVIGYAGEMLQQRRVVGPEEILDLIGHELQLELCFPQRFIVGVSSPLGPEPGPEFYAGRKTPPSDSGEAFDDVDLRSLMERLNETVRGRVAAQHHAFMRTIDGEGRIETRRRPAVSEIPGVERERITRSDD